MRIHIEESDARMKYLTASLLKRGYNIAAPEEIGERPCCLIVSPGMKTHLLHDWMKRLPARSILVGGQGDPALFQAAGRLGLRYVNLSADEAFAVGNALPTAEGALMLILEHTDSTVCGMDIMILGFGRVGKAVAAALEPLGARLPMRASSPIDRAWAQGREAHDLSHLPTQLPRCSVIINTAPARVLGLRELSFIEKDSLLIELASAPYGYDEELAREMGLRPVLAAALPGKVAPKTAAAVMEEAVLRALEGEPIDRE